MEAMDTVEASGLNLYFVESEAGDAWEGEYFQRAIVYAPSADEARARIRTFIELTNEAEATAPSEEQRPDLAVEAEDQVSEEDSGPISYDPELLNVVLLAANVEKPEYSPRFDADDILIFETGWSAPS